MSTDAGIPQCPEWSTVDAAQALANTRAWATQATTDLFLPDDARLREDDRAEIARMLGMLVAFGERNLRTRLAAAFADHPTLAATLAARHVAIARPILDRAGALRDPALVTALARHAARGRLAERLRRQRDLARLIEPAAPDPTEAFAADADPAIAAAPRARAPETKGPLLPAELQHRLMVGIAAALRDYLIATHGIAALVADERITRCAEAALAGYDEAATVDARALALVHALRAGGRSGDMLAADALAAGDVAFAIALLAVRAGVDCDAAWDMTTDPVRLLLLCRAAGLSPPAAATVALLIDPGDDDEALADRLEGYAALAPERAAAAIGLWRYDPVYRESILALDTGRRA
ncbi:MAG: DUF2336 domain-containing protein [Sphingomonas sp.]